MELHAWFNPFRARHPSGKSIPARNFIGRTQPGIVKSYGSYQWLDPGVRASQEHSMNVIMDVVRRYDIDGVHLDDYFYPYQVKDSAGNTIDFPDEASWRAYRSAGGKFDRSERRRQSINYFVRSLYANVKKEKPWVRVGISPFGIWRPGHPGPIKGTDAYEQIYADSRKWLHQGWLDYCAPQLYWPIKPDAQSYPLLLKWWADQNQAGRHVWPGLASHKAGDQFTAGEIPQQIALARAQTGVDGHLHWNMSGLMNNQTLIKSLHNRVYTEQALPPAALWLDSSPPPAPAVSRSRSRGNRSVTVSWEEPRRGERAARWVLQLYSNGRWISEILPAQVRQRVLNDAALASTDRMALRAVDRCANVSAPKIIHLR